MQSARPQPSIARPRTDLIKLFPSNIVHLATIHIASLGFPFDHICMQILLSSSASWSIKIANAKLYQMRFRIDDGKERIASAREKRVRAAIEMRENQRQQRGNDGREEEVGLSMKCGSHGLPRGTSAATS